MTTASTSLPTRIGVGRGRLLAPGLLLLIAGPVLFDLGYALHPSLPEGAAAALEQVGDVRERHAAAKVIVAVGGLLMIGLVLTLRRYLVPGRGRTLATVGVTLAAVGMAFNSLSQATHGYLLFWAVAPGVDPAAGLAVLEVAQTNEGVVTLPVSFWSVPMLALGLVLFAASLWWANTVPRWVPVAIVMAGFAAGAIGTGPAMLAVLAVDVAAFGTALVVASRRADAVAQQGRVADHRPGRGRTHAAAAGTVAVILMAVPTVVAVASFAVMAAAGGQLVASHVLVGVVVGSVSAVLGGYLVARLPGNPMGWLFAWSGVAYVATVAVTAWVTAAQTWEWPGVLAVAWVSEWVYVLALGPQVTFLLLLFPDGFPLPPAGVCSPGPAARSSRPSWWRGCSRQRSTSARTSWCRTPSSAARPPRS